MGLKSNRINNKMEMEEVLWVYLDVVDLKNQKPIKIKTSNQENKDIYKKRTLMIKIMIIGNENETELLLSFYIDFKASV